MNWRRVCMAIVALLIVVVPAVTQAQDYVERQFELVYGHLLYQNQFYATAPTQTLFHSQTATGTDTEDFSFSPVPGGGIALARTSSASEIATDTGFFTSFSSFKRFNCPTGEGYMHTSINDPLVSRTPVFSSLIFPSMIKQDQITNIAGSASGNGPAANGGTGKDNNTTNRPAKQAAAGMPTINGTGNATPNNLTITGPLIKKQFSSNWDRLTTNVIGRSGIDSTYSNLTSFPSYINPWNVIKLANQFNVMSETRNMTHAGSYLQQRMWAL